jgi:hypothetical protein
MENYPTLRKLGIGTRFFYDFLWFVDHCLGPTRTDRILPRARERLSARARREISTSGEGKRLPIPRVSEISVEDFKRDYLRRGRPVILAGAAAKWDCVGRWSPQFLAERYGTDPVALIDASPKVLENTDHQLEYTTLREVIESMGSGPLSKYSRFNTLLKDHPELTKDFDLGFLKRRRNALASGKTFQVFIGGAGTKTHIHADSEHNLFTQVHGKKNWILYPPGYDGLIDPVISRTPYFFTGFDPDHPDFERYPLMRYADSLEGTLEPGDILFVPPSWWHHVKNPEDSIGFGFRWFSAHDSFRQDFMMALLMMLAVDPPIYVATKHREDFTKIFSYRAKRALRKSGKR